MCNMCYKKIYEFCDTGNPKNTKVLTSAFRNKLERSLSCVTYAIQKIYDLGAMSILKGVYSPKFLPCENVT